MKKITIGEIAEKSGVSISTVSLVLNQRPGISSETRARVLEVAEELGYKIKSDPAPLPDSTLHNIGVIMKTDAEIFPQANPFYSKVLIGIEEVCRSKGINLLFSTLPLDENNCPLETPQMLYNNSVDGLLMVGIFLDASHLIQQRVAAKGLVLVDGYSSPEVFDQVVSDNFHAAYQAVEHLIHKGHQHIGLVGSDPVCYPSLKERRNGYLRALKENNINQTYMADFNLNRSKGFHETINLLKMYPQITGLFCVNDDVGAAAIRAAQSLGLRVPEDLSIIGYDDTYIAQHTHPALTTIHVDTLAMGRAAVHLLSLRKENPELSRMTLVIHHKLIERESVSTARQSSRKSDSHPAAQPN